MIKRKIILICLIGLICSDLSAQEILWIKKANLPKPMRGTAITCSNKIYFMEANHQTSGVYEYSPITDAWDKKTYMATQGWNVNLAEVNGIIYAIGGDPFRNRNESYDPVANIWNTLAPMPTSRQHSNCCVADGKIYVMGGITSWADKTDKNEVYDPKTDSWQSLSPLPYPFENPIIASVNNCIYTLCGDALWMYDTSADRWEAKANCPAWISVMFGCAVIGDKIIIPGGQNEDGKAVSTVYIYDTGKDKWSRSADLPEPIQIGGITALNGKVYMIGGCSNNFRKYNKVYEGTLME